MPVRTEEERITPSTRKFHMQDIIIYNTPDGRSSVALYAKDGNVWLNQSQIAELFATSKPNISLHIANIFRDNELDKDSVVKYYLTTAADGKEYNVEYYSLQMIIAIGYRVRGVRGGGLRGFFCGCQQQLLEKEG